MGRQPPSTSSKRGIASDALVLTAELPAGLLEDAARRGAELALAEVRRVTPAPWLDVDQAATYLACSRHRVYDLVSEGRLRCAKDGRRSLFRKEWLDAALEDG